MSRSWLLCSAFTQKTRSKLCLWTSSLCYGVTKRLAASFVFGPLGFIIEWSHKRPAPSFVFEPLASLIEPRKRLAHDSLQALSADRSVRLVLVIESRKRFAPSFGFGPLDYRISHGADSLQALSSDRLALLESHANNSLQLCLLIAWLCSPVHATPDPKLCLRTNWFCFRVTQTTRCKLRLRDYLLPHRPLDFVVQSRQQHAPSSVVEALLFG